MTLNQARQVQKSSPTWITEPEVLLQSLFTFLHNKYMQKHRINSNLGIFFWRPVYYRIIPRTPWSAKKMEETSFL